MSMNYMNLVVVHINYLTNLENACSIILDQTHLVNWQEFIILISHVMILKKKTSTKIKLIYFGSEKN